MLRSLAVASLPTRVVCFDASPDSAGVHRGHRARLIPAVTDPAYREAVLDACVREGVQALIPGLDPELEPLAEMADDLAAVGCVLVGSPPAVTRLLRDKLRCAEHFEALGLPFVRTVPIARAEELALSCGFPLLAKPADGSASRGLQVVFDRAELRALAEAAPNCVVQEYLLSDTWGKHRSTLRREDVFRNHALVQRDEIVVQVVIDRDGTCIGVFTSNNTLKDGATVLMRPIEHDETGTTRVALEMAKHLAGLGLVGPCNIQCKVTSDGPFVFEINPRFSGGTGARASLGFNEVEASLRRLVLGEDVEVARACLQTRYDRICGLHPAEFVIDAEAVAELRRGGVVEGRAGRH
ncbi:MAG: ATP-grasp domain-containing protein [Deltaproteobacteria bacterium]|nr:ATP-grasp domain-containing protein [Nannocystaceae bacterium]